MTPPAKVRLWTYRGPGGGTRHLLALSSQAVVLGEPLRHTYARSSTTESLLGDQAEVGTFRGPVSVRLSPRTWGAPLPPPLLEEVLQLALLLLGGALRLIRAALRLYGLVAGHGSGSFFGPALELVHRPFALILAAALSSHRFSFLRSLPTERHSTLHKLDAERARIDTLR
jgi:hypothetical protein